jgi:choline-glycine betaine transporter
MRPLVLISCFFPLAIIWIIMKLSLWVSAVNDEQKYVRQESLKPHGPYVANAYEDVDAEEEEYGDRTDYR